jgi:hypothetical protein
MAGGSKYEAQFRVIRPDDSTCWLDARGTLVPDEPTFSTKPKDRVRRSKLIAKYGLADGINRFAQGQNE